MLFYSLHEIQIIWVGRLRKQMDPNSFLVKEDPITHQLSSHERLHFRKRSLIYTYRATFFRERCPVLIGCAFISVRQTYELKDKMKIVSSKSNRSLQNLSKAIGSTEPFTIEVIAQTSTMTGDKDTISTTNTQDSSLVVLRLVLRPRRLLPLYPVVSARTWLSNAFFFEHHWTPGIQVSLLMAS